MKTITLILLLAFASLAQAQTTNSDSASFSNLSNAMEASPAGKRALEAQLQIYYQNWDDTIWKRNLADALAEAKATNKPVFILITGAPWSTNSKAFEDNVLSDAFTVDRLKKDYVLLKYVNTRDEADMPVSLAAEMKTVKRDMVGDRNAYSNAADTPFFPLIIILDSTGHYLTQIVNYKNDSASRFRVTLSETVAKAQTPAK